MAGNHGGWPFTLRSIQAVSSASGSILFFLYCAPTLPAKVFASFAFASLALAVGFVMRVKSRIRI